MEEVQKMDQRTSDNIDRRYVSRNEKMERSLLGRSKGQRELNPFLFQLPPPFWHLLFEYPCEHARFRVTARTKDDFKFEKQMWNKITYSRESYDTQLNPYL